MCESGAVDQAEKNCTLAFNLILSSTDLSKTHEFSLQIYFAAAIAFVEQTLISSLYKKLHYPLVIEFFFNYVDMKCKRVGLTLAWVFEKQSK